MQSIAQTDSERLEWMLRRAEDHRRNLMRSHTDHIPDPLMARALAAWREAHPEGLIGRLIDLHQRDPQKALAAAYYVERYHSNRTPPGLSWPYQWLMADVASWPSCPSPSCPSCNGSGRWADDILCGRCNGEGVNQ